MNVVQAEIYNKKLTKDTSNLRSEFEGTKTELVELKTLKKTFENEKSKYMR